MTTINVILGAANDSAQEHDDNTLFVAAGTSVIPTSSTGAASTRIDAGFRLPAVTIPKGSTVTASTTQVYVTAGTAVDVTIYGEAVDNAVDFAATADVVDRARSTASVAWSATGLTKTAFNTTPSLTAIYDELVKRPGFVSNNAINLIFIGGSTTARALSCQAYAGSTTNCTKASITYTAGRAPAFPNPLAARRTFLRNR